MSSQGRGLAAERQARSFVVEAGHCLAAQRPGRAEMWLQEAVNHFPGTEAAFEAAEWLARLRELPHSPR